MASLEAGRRLADRYVLKERLGDGGHAEVWAALDEPWKQTVALKFLHLRGWTVEEAFPMLLHEARMAQRLDHPGVLQVEMPMRDGEYVFLPVEYAPGGSASRLRGAPWRRLLPVLLQVVQVLQHAHERGVVHRDIKPGNVLFSAGGLVRVADFGTSAHTGSADAPANGSPFSASPQQLRGDAASPADDVYGLGALTYELLTRYPPFYPDFDARRVQEQDPPRAVPVHPAPAQLLDLVAAMLMRDAEARPSLETVAAEFNRCLALAPGEAEGALMVESSAPPIPATPSRRRRPSAWWLLAAAAVAGAGVLVMLPEAAPPPIATAEPEANPPEVARVADAVVPEPVPEPAPAETAPPEEPGPAAVPAPADDLRIGQQHLAAHRPAEARAAFRRVLARQPDHAAALAGLATAARQEDLLAALADATRIEASGDLDAARERLRLLVANQPDFAPARSALERVDARLRDRAFEDHLAAAADALRRGQLAGAEAAYARAAAIHPREVRVLDGQQRIAEIHRNQQNAADLAAGAALEEAERWQEAVELYQRTLARDAGLRFAQDGLARSERRAQLDAELADYQARPERLTAPAVRQAAQRALARGEATAENAPRLRAQLAWLRETLGAVVEPVRVELTSDNSTQVSVVQVGELGRFQMRELTLPPGQYTVIGRREGFRDVRFVLKLAPGQRQMALSVQCTERI